MNFLTQIFAPGGFFPVVLYVPLAGWIFWRHGQRRYLSGTWERPRPISRAGSLFLGLPDAHFARLLYYVWDAVFAPFSDAGGVGHHFGVIPSTPCRF